MLLIWSWIYTPVITGCSPTSIGYTKNKIIPQHPMIKQDFLDSDTNLSKLKNRLAIIAASPAIPSAEL
jgi:hypothetical protein